MRYAIIAISVRALLAWLQRVDITSDEADKRLVLNSLANL